jgi:hypothetical protein
MRPTRIACGSACGTGYAVSRTDRIKAAIVEELENRRAELDAERGLKRVILTVVMDCKSGRPYVVDFEKKAGRELAA